MDDIEALREENSRLKITLEVLLERINDLNAEVSQLKKDVADASKPRPKVTPQTISITNENVEKLIAGLKGYLHQNALRKKKMTVAIHLITMHNLGAVTSHQLRQASGLSQDGFSKQSLSVRKVGLMQYNGHRKYLLTDKSKELLSKVFGE